MNIKQVKTTLAKIVQNNIELEKEGLECTAINLQGLPGMIFK